MATPLGEFKPSSSLTGDETKSIQDKIKADQVTQANLLSQAKTALAGGQQSWNTFLQQAKPIVNPTNQAAANWDYLTKLPELVNNTYSGFSQASDERQFNASMGDINNILDNPNASFGQLLEATTLANNALGGATIKKTAGAGTYQDPNKPVDNTMSVANASQTGTEKTVADKSAVGTTNTKTALTDYLKSQNLPTNFAKLKELATQYGISNYSSLPSENTQLLEALKTGAPKQQAPANGSLYSVKSGDTLTKIANQFGVSLQTLLSANPTITNPNLIYPNQKINVPMGGNVDATEIVNKTQEQLFADATKTESTNNGIEKATLAEKTETTEPVFKMPSSTDIYNKFLNTEDIKNSKQALIDYDKELAKLDAQEQALEDDIRSQIEGEAPESVIRAMVAEKARRLYPLKASILAEKNALQAKLTNDIENAKLEYQMALQDQENGLKYLDTLIAGGTKLTTEQMKIADETLGFGTGFTKSYVTAKEKAQNTATEKEALDLKTSIYNLQEKMLPTESFVVDGKTYTGTKGLYVENPTIADQIKAAENGYKIVNGKLEKITTQSNVLQYADGEYGGQCGSFVHKIVDGIPAMGDTFGTKSALVDKKGILASEWSTNPKIGDVLIIDTKTPTGHAAVVNSINSDGTVTLSESNWKGDEKVTNTRKISINDPAIYGALRGTQKSYEVKNEYDQFTDENIALSVIPTQLKNSEAETNRLLAGIRSGLKQGLNPYQVADNLMGFKINKPDSFSTEMRKYIGVADLNSTQISEVSRLINEGNKTAAISKIENILMEKAKKADPDAFIGEATVKTATTRANILDSYIDKLDKSPIGVVKGSMEKFLRGMKSNEAQQIATQVTFLVAEMRNRLSGTAVTDSEARFLADIIPSLSDTPDNFMTKLQALKTQPLIELNSVRSVYELPSLDEVSLQDKNARIKLYSGLTETVSNSSQSDNDYNNYLSDINKTQ